jgi:hypothetical protein
MRKTVRPTNYRRRGSHVVDYSHFEKRHFGSWPEVSPLEPLWIVIYDYPPHSLRFRIANRVRRIFRRDEQAEIIYSGPLSKDGGAEA